MNTIVNTSALAISCDVYKFEGVKLIYLGVYRRHEMKSIRHEISTHHERYFVYITFYCRQNEIKLRFEGGPTKKG